MAHITEFSITNLAGIDGIYHKVLDRHVNVFFGKNGGGKTSLLRILDSAMNFRTKTNTTYTLRNVPFTKAEVKVYSINYDQVFTHTIEKSTILESIKNTPNTGIGDVSFSPFEDDISVSPPNFSSSNIIEDTSVTTWVTTPEPPETDMSKWAHTYLPTSRLYVGSSFLSLGLRDTAPEEKLEELFASSLQRIWRNYYYENIVNEINKAQEEGLASILKAVLSTSRRRTRKKKRSTIELQTAYQRMYDFLQRRGSSNIMGSFENFTHGYNENPQLRNVVDDIDQIEQRISQVMTPRNLLVSLIQDMFSGNKTVKFGEDSIDVISSKQEDIGVKSLSSGEKHILQLFIESLLVGPSTLMIDEPELSLHIDWQNEFTSTMNQLNNSMQLILATHSPEIMANVSDERIFNL